jgi:hypothetical protein
MGLALSRLLLLAPNGPTGLVWRCSLIDANQKWLAKGQTLAEYLSRLGVHNIRIDSVHETVEQQTSQVGATLR